tara:strand:+ start:895 stop:1209 length:315 start_codon:yes stop_codon:yes gene_type:complete
MLVAPVPPFAAGSVPVTPVVNGKPVTLVITPEAGVPRAGVVKTGELKEPVASVKTGAVRVLLVSVSVPVNVTRFVGVIMSDKFAMCYASGLVGQSPVSRSGKSA